MSYCKVILMGRLVRDPELSHTPKGTAVAKLTIVVNRTWTENGEKKEAASFIDCTAWGKAAEVITQYRKKGGELLLDGRLEQENWTDKDTQAKRSKLGVVIESFQLIGKQDAAKASESASTPKVQPEAEPALDGTDPTVPF